MNNLYHKVAVASVCTALSFTLGANQEAKAATLTLYPTYIFLLEGYENGEVNGGYSEYDTGSHPFSVQRAYDGRERRAFYDFDISNLSLATNTVIRSVILNTPIREFHPSDRSLYLSFFGYVANEGGYPSETLFNGGVGLSIEDAYNPSYNPQGLRNQINLDVTYFVNEQVSNGNDYLGFGVRVANINYPDYVNYGDALLRGYYDVPPTLIIETEPVPEPTTIFGSALALGLGGWLKRKKSSQHNKTTPQL
jgi:hypothetical protein